MLRSLMRSKFGEAWGVKDSRVPRNAGVLASRSQGSKRSQVVLLASARESSVPRAASRPSTPFAAAGHVAVLEIAPSCSEASARLPISLPAPRGGSDE